jgi:CheY-like chemotaxis protein
VRGLIERPIAQMVRLVDDVIDAGRIRNGTLPIRKVPFEVADAVRRGVEQSRQQDEGGGHKLEVSLPSQLAYVDGDPIRLAQVVTQLLHYAAKNAPEGGIIKIAAQRNDNDVVISIHDAGIGMVMEHVSNAHETRAQAARSEQRTDAGLGIGLELVRGIVGLHGGTLTVRGAGKGSEFQVRIPVSTAPVHRQLGTLADCEQHPGRRRELLVASKNLEEAEWLAHELRDMGHWTNTAQDGFEALRMVSTIRFDAALLDVELPKLNGFDTVRRIRRAPGGRDIVLVALTDWTQDDDVPRALDAGFDQHLTKPVDRSALESLLAALG